MSLGISSSVYPTARSAAIFAMGKPVAFDASAEERETRGFISMTTRRPVFGSTANWMFDPPVSTPIFRMTAFASLRISWYWRSDRVIWGATVIESPVWTPIASKFSIEQTTMTLSARSRITSSSNSFHPSTDSSIRTSCAGDSARPWRTIRRKSSRPRAAPPPEPPRVKDGRTTTGKPISAASASACSSERARPDRGTSAPISSIASLEELAVLGEAHRALSGADELDVALLEDPPLRQGQGQVDGRSGPRPSEGSHRAARARRSARGIRESAARCRSPRRAPGPS